MPFKRDRNGNLVNVPAQSSGEIHALTGGGNLLSPNQGQPQMGSTPPPQLPPMGGGNLMTHPQQQPQAQPQQSNQFGGTIDPSVGGVQNALQIMRGLKQQLTSGTLNAADYLKQVTPIVQQTSTIVGNIAKGGSNAANSVNPIWQTIQNENFAKPYQGGWQALLPVSEQEYANLPGSSKPTAEQINQGLVPTQSLPGNVALNTQIQQAQQDQTKLQTDAQATAKQQQADTTKQLGDMYSQFYDSTKQRYDQGYQDIATSLQNQMQQAQQHLTNGPEAESFKGNFNNLGLLNSGAFSEGLANKFGDIEQNTVNSLLQSRLDEQNALQGAASQGVNALSNFGVGAQQQLQNIGDAGYNALSGLGQAGLARNFSVNDWFQQADLEKQLADLQNNQYLSAINSSKQNPWAQLGIGVASGAAAGLAGRH